MLCSRQTIGFICLFHFASLITARVGFELELPEFKVFYSKDRTRLLNSKIILYQSDSNLWNVTVDSVEGHAYLEIVTAPFDYFDHPLGHQQFLQATEEISDFLGFLANAGLETYQTKSVVKMTPADATNEELAIQYTPDEFPGDILVAPQVTFGLLPSHFHYLACHKVFTDSELHNHESVFLNANDILLMSRICERINGFMNYIRFSLKLELFKDPKFASFVTLFGLYVSQKSTDPLLYPKMVAGTFLSRVSFAEMFLELPNDIREAIRQKDLLHEVARTIRGTYYDKAEEKVISAGFIGANGTVEHGPTIDEWIYGFTREYEPIDLLSNIDSCQSMGVMAMEEANCGENELQKHWVIENRGIPLVDAKVTTTWMENLFVYLSSFNLEQVTTEFNWLKTRQSIKKLLGN